MRLGAENRNKTIAAVVLGLLALLAFTRMISSFGGAPQQASGPAANSAATSAALAAASGGNATATGARTSSTRRSRSQRDRRTAGPAPAQSLDPRLNLALLEQSEKVVYSGTGRNIFKMEEEPPPMPTPVAPAEMAQQKPPRTVPQAPAPPPAIPLKFYGWASKPGETRSVFLSANGSDIFVAREGEIIDRRYKIVRIQPNNVEVEDVLTNFHQTLPLTQG